MEFAISITVIWSWPSLLPLDYYSKGRELVLALLCPSLFSLLQDLHWPPSCNCLLPHLGIRVNTEGDLFCFPESMHCARLCSTGVNTVRLGLSHSRGVP